MTRHRLSVIVCLGILVLLAGCGTAIDVRPNQSPTPPPAAASEPCATSLGFYGLGGPYDAWDEDSVRLGYTLATDASVVFVAFENDTVIGTTHDSTDHAVAVDGTPLPLDRPLDGNHTIRVVAYADTNGNGAFDRGTDRPCYRGDERVQAGPRTIDFSSFD